MTELVNHQGTVYRESASGSTTWNKARTIAYWAFTSIVVFEMAAGGIWDLLRIEYVRVILSQLGYPMYLLTILGIWKIPCSLVLMLPRFGRIKEWAYAGAFFTYSGAAMSHFAAGQGFHRAGDPLVLAAFTLLSWALRPASRRLVAGEAQEKDTSLVSWLVPIAIVVAMLIISFLTLPKGPPPA